MTQMPIADSARLALPAEAAQIAAIQRRSWSQLLPAPLRDAALTSVSVEEMAEVWHHAISRPPESRFRVMVAVEGRSLVGFGTTTPSPDPDADPADDGQIDEFMIDPTAQRRGHGSRLMHACVDTLRADGFRRARHWVATNDDVRRQFFTAAGWDADGGHRELGTEAPAEAEAAEAEAAEAEAAGSAAVGSAAVAGEAATLKQIRLHTDIAEAVGA